MTLILASSSPFRAAILARTGLVFEQHSADIDESAEAGEAPGKLVCRLGVAKARAVAAAYPEALIIGSDQICALADGEFLGKPGDRRSACTQLARLSGQEVVFYTSVALYNAAARSLSVDYAQTRVSFQVLSETTIERYVQREQPYQCAGSFKSEGLGACLFERVCSDDPDALVGLPLIRLLKMLKHEGIDPLAQTSAAAASGQIGTDG